MLTPGPRQFFRALQMCMDLTPSTIVRIDKYTIVSHGKTSIEKVNRFFNISLPITKKVSDMDELVNEHLKRVKKGSKITINDIEIIVDDMDAGDIIKLRLVKPKKFFKQLDDHLKGYQS